MKQPEIICDAPYRVEPGRPVPVFIIVKDADKYPVELAEVVIQCYYENGEERAARFPFANQRLNDPIWWDSINFMPEFPGLIRIVPHVVLKKGKKQRSFIVDNYRGTSKSPLMVYCSETSLPGGEDWYHGDIHCHSYYSSDQVEFGAPLEASALAGFTMGLNWMGATDHSYDLDDKLSDYMANDPLLTKWRIMQKVAELLQESFTVIPGEEVTCRTASGKNCHMLALNSERFIKGSGDSGENGLKTETEFSIGEAASTCLEWGGITCAAHPMEKIPFPEKLFLNRGEWSLDDMKTPGVLALQFYNGQLDKGFYNGMSAWIKMLLSGSKILAFGGSDSHGDFNRRRRLGLPFLSVTENAHHAFGSVRTVVKSVSSKKDDICDALTAGHVVVTSGPFIDLSVTSGDLTAGPGDTAKGGAMTFQADFRSTPEFAALKTCRIVAGVAKESEERLLAIEYCDGNENVKRYDGSCEILDLLYIRAECETQSGKICFTNPVWIE